jgi:hypothetical protein
MKLDHLAERHFSNFPEDVQAILNLFPNEYELKSDPDGRYFDVMRGDEGRYVFYQAIARTAEQRAKNLRYFFCWVREGMPDGYTGDYNNSSETHRWWEREE